MISTVEPDLILIEGYKYERFPKAVFIRHEGDFGLLSDLNGIKLVLYQDWIPNTDSVSFHREDQRAVKWLADFLEQQM